MSSAGSFKNPPKTSSFSFRIQLTTSQHPPDRDAKMHHLISLFSQGPSFTYLRVYFHINWARKRALVVVARWPGFFPIFCRKKRVQYRVGWIIRHLPDIAHSNFFLGWPTKKISSFFGENESFFSEWQAYVLRFGYFAWNLLACKHSFFQKALSTTFLDNE